MRHRQQGLETSFHKFGVARERVLGLAEKPKQYVQQLWRKL